MDIWNRLNDISNTASFYLERTKIIQGNIANADTPNYRPKDLKFQRVMEEHLKLKKEDPRHIEPEVKQSKFKIIELNKISGYDRNKVNLDEELSKLAESSIMYKALIESLRKEISKIKLSIQGR